MAPTNLSLYSATLMSHDYNIGDNMYLIKVKPALTAANQRGLETL